MATKMTYDNLAHELGRVALSRDELRFELYNVKKERDEALAKLAAMESQKPYAYELFKPSPFGFDGCKGVLVRGAPPAIDDFHKPLYELPPVPADKPAVAVPDGWKLVPINPTAEQIKAGGEDDCFCLCCGYDNGGGEPSNVYDAMLAAAPSHSQQSAPWLKDHQIAEIINSVSDVARHYCRTQQLRERIAGVLRPVLCGYGDRCPSHESEQP